MEDKVYNVQEVQKILKISRSGAYRYIKNIYATQDPFMVLRIGNLYRIPKRPFDSWICGEVYTVEEVRIMLNVSRSATYVYIKDIYKLQHPFRVVRIGNLYRISKESFDRWICGDSILGTD